MTVRTVGHTGAVALAIAAAMACIVILAQLLADGLLYLGALAFG